MKNQTHKESVRGMTLIEVLLAIAILGVTLVVMLTAITRCLVVLRVAEDFHKAIWALSAAEADAPMIQKPGGKPEDLTFGPAVYDGITYTRTIEDPDEDDPAANIRLLRVTMLMRWEGRGQEQIMRIPMYVTHEE
jgi:prepilin-type N-terminal cleavage/methylation domain-containing protein